MIKPGTVVVCKKRDTIGEYPDTLHLLEIGKRYTILNVSAINSTIGLYRAYISIVDGQPPIQFFYSLDIEIIKNQLNRTKHKDEIDYINKLVRDCQEWGLFTYFDTVENYRESQIDKIV